LTLRTSTERPITVTVGTNRVVGVGPDAIYASWRDLVEGRWRPGRLPDLWDGHAAARVVGILLRQQTGAPAARGQSARG
jgi:UDP-N-acetylglucosamine 2-epimerase (non-hydrolysing)